MLQASQGIPWTAHDLPTEQSFQNRAPPTWRETKVSIEGDPAGLGRQGSDYDELVI